MLAGHPFYTENFDAVRAEQRRVLRLVPDWIMRRHAPESAEAMSVHENDRPFVEHLLRARASELLAVVTPLLERLTIGVSAERLARFWSHDLRVFNSELATDYDKRRHIEAIVETERDAAAGASVGQQVGDLRGEELAPALYQVITVLAVADLVADDGYRDPRTS